MLSELRIENFAIIDHLTLSLRRGLIAFTGETGAGKSIILDAIAAVIGGKVEPAMIRAGADRALVEATFTLPEEIRAAVHDVLQREDLLDEPDTLLLSREIRREGRSVARVNGRAVSAGLMRELGSFLVDIHGQSEHLSLLNVREHIHLLDRFAGLQEALDDYRREYQRLQGIRRELEKLRQMEADAERRTDLLTYQLQEIESARLRVGEDEELRRERDRLANAENLASLAQQSLTLLDEGTPDTPALSDLAGQLVQLLHGMVRMDASQGDLLEQAETLAELASDLSRSLQTYLDGIEFNPRRLAQVEERLDVIHKIQRKYNGSIESALAFAEKVRAELETIAHATERIAELEEEETRALQELSARARTLSERRKEAAARLEKAVERELSDLSMNGARFAVDFHTDPDPEGIPLPDGSRVGFDALGFDRVEFLIAPNLGEGLKPLVKIASGGETSRLMLALKNVLAQADYVPTLIFDEIDQGIGGRVGAVVGEKLWQLGRRHEVLCVTHLPQLAAYGDLHFSVRKSVHEGRTTTQVQALEEDERLTELALMLGGVNPANLAAARETRLMAQQRMQELAVKI